MQYVTFTDRHGVEKRQQVYATFWDRDIMFVVTSRSVGLYDPGEPYQVIGVDPDQTTHHEMGRTEYLSFDTGI